MARLFQLGYLTWRGNLFALCFMVAADILALLFLNAARADAADITLVLTLTVTFNTLIAMSVIRQDTDQLAHGGWEALHASCVSTLLVSAAQLVPLVFLVSVPLLGSWLLFPFLPSTAILITLVSLFLLVVLRGSLLSVRRFWPFAFIIVLTITIALTSPGFWPLILANMNSSAIALLSAVLAAFALQGVPFEIRQK